MTPPLETVELVENGEPDERPLPTEVGVALAATRLVDAAPVPGSTGWVLTPTSRVGSLRVGQWQVTVRPKIPVDRVLFLLSFSPAGAWWDDPLVRVAHAADLLAAVAAAYTRMAETAVLRGLLQGYRTRDESLPVVRGRIREADQIRTRYGFLVPVEVRYDDFTVDIAENRWLRAAGRRLLRLPGVDPTVRHRLRRLDLLLADVAAAVSPRELGPWHPTRLNTRYHDALRLAEVIVASASFEQRGEDLSVSGFVLDMAKVFEDFVCRSLGAALTARAGGRAVAQDRRWSLDDAHDVRLRPDLVWDREDGTPRAVVDAKYKAEKPSGFPDADLYQLLAYCTALGLPAGHLVYAKGNEAGRTYHVPGAGVTLHAHTVDLDQPPAGLLAQLDALAATLAGTTAAPARASVAAGT